MFISWKFLGMLLFNKINSCRSCILNFYILYCGETAVKYVTLIFLARFLVADSDHDKQMNDCLYSLHI